MKLHTNFYGHTIPDLAAKNKGQAFFFRGSKVDEFVLFSDKIGIGNSSVSSLEEEKIDFECEFSRQKRI